MGKNRLHKRLENIAQKLGYKEIRYGIPYGIPFARICWKNRKNIKDLKSLVEDQKSLDVINAVIKSKISRNVNKYISRIYDEKEDIQTKDIFGRDLRDHPDHYFAPDIIRYISNEVFVDAGGFIGDTTLNFIEKSKDIGFKKIHIFETSEKTYKELKENLKFHNVDESKVKCHKLGLFSENTTKTFIYDSLNPGGSKIGDAGTEKISVVKLDDYLSDEEKNEISFIKMDIEGAEMDALKGMQGIIKKNKPKLAISAYHLDTDLWEIPLYIKQLNPDYKIYIRLYAKWYSEFVCYAI